MDQPSPSRRVAPRRSVPQHRKTLYYVGVAVSVLGLLLFLSTFVTFCTHFGEFSGFEQRAKEVMGTAIAGVVLLVAGTWLVRLGRSGLAGAGVVLDPEQAREDLEPWSRMAGGMVGDALDEAGLKVERGAPAIKVRCGQCKALNDEHDRYCGQCGQPLV
jgi:hypothetical protein